MRHLYDRIPAWLSVCTALWASVFLSACDGLGRALVDRDPPPDAGRAVCMHPANCPLLPSEPPPLELDLTVGPRTSCLPDCGQQPCAPDLTIEEASALIEFAPLSCATLVLRLPGGSERIILTDLSLSDATLHVITEQPVELVLSGAHLLHTALTLQGPVQLRFEGQSELQHTRVEPRDAASSLELVEATLRQVRLGDEPAVGFRSIAATRSSLQEVSVRGSSVSIRSTSAQKVNLRVRELFAVDLESDDLTLALETGTFSDVTLRRFSLLSCGDLLITSSSLAHSQLQPCRAAPLRVYTSDVYATQLTGAVEAVATGFDDVTFGSPDIDTRVELWRCSLSRSSLCRGLTRFAMGQVDEMACVNCETLEAPESALCRAERPNSVAPSRKTPPEMHPSCRALEQPSPCVPAIADERPL